ncbi:Dystroglycan [Desmophyllum pertusum]|uniref:Dystroglycan n=1 Tax=Desmophyllum pertusum TaxID=174260 RepID=A0A9W9YS05_9CNID|nr:Dystroglycan [Desmophyllum pertusum]
MTWTNDSLPTDTCDEEKVQYVANKMLLPNGEVREEFRDALQGFPVISASEERVGVCNGSSPVPIGQPIVTGQEQSKMEEHLWYKHVLVGLVIVLIIIVLFGLLIWCYRRRRPKPSNEKRTFKKRKPIVLGTEIELKPIQVNRLFFPTMIQVSRHLTSQRRHWTNPCILMMRTRRIMGREALLLFTSLPAVLSSAC